MLKTLYRPKCVLFPEQAVAYWTRKYPALRWETVPGALIVLHCISHLHSMLPGDPDIAKPHIYMYAYV